ncbi:nuclear transport factor 2 family protein [Streptomyces sp. HUAS MG91]|uniref:Nuclear transport factor 2 family protein n=1 Tax=Streptomyces tabacisoli TaxID=3156398 RepID=A0AAU8J177_9ACTN
MSDALSDTLSDVMPDDRTALIDLLARWDRWLDESRFTADETAVLFTPDAEAVTPGGVSRGIDALTAQAARGRSIWAATQHLHTNPVVEIDGDRAAIGINRLIFLVAHDPAGTPETVPAPTLTLGERCRVEAARTADGWRITRLGGTLLWASDPEALARATARGRAATAAQAG